MNGGSYLVFCDTYAGVFFVSVPSRGEWGFLYRLKLKDSYLGEEVSIPSRGDWGFLPNFIFICIYIISLVSVPSRGEWEVLLNDDVVNLFQVMFPYPREVNGGSNPRALFRTVSRT